MMTLSRRAFLRGLLAAGGLSWLGAACSQTLPQTVTPPISPSPLPPATRVPLLSTAQAASPSSPLASPGPLDTATPPVTPTPWPTPTPAHYTRPSKLGPAVVHFSAPEIMAFIEAGRPAVVKIWDDLGPAAVIKERSPNTWIVGRTGPKFDFLTWLDRKEEKPLELAASFVSWYAEQYQANPAVDYWEGFNEPPVGDAGLLQVYTDFEVERVRLMAELGLRCCVGNFATGTPDLALWEVFFPALQAARAHEGILALHEYSAPVMQFGYGPNQLDPSADAGDEGWLTGRYRKVYRHCLPPELHLPLVITECGVDGLVGSRPGPPGGGWHDFVAYWLQNYLAPDGETAYLDQLTWYDELLQQDDYVLGASIFAFGTQGGQYASYDMLGAMTERITSYLAAHPAKPHSKT